MELIKPGTNINFLGRQKMFFGISAVAVSISIIAFATVGLNLGIDFTGGTEVQLSFNKDVGAAEVRAAVTKSGFLNPEVQNFEAGDKVTYLVRIREQVTLIAGGKAAELQAAIEAEKDAFGPLKGFEAADSGDRIYLQFDQEIDTEALKGLFKAQGLEEARIQMTGRPEDRRYTVHLQEIQSRIALDLRERFGDDFAEVSRAQIVGPKAGKRLRNDGALAVLVALGAILFYIAVRFDFRFAPGAVAALLHDLTITIGIFSVFSNWLEFSLATIAALLTIVGYSLNDTIVVFDRIRENFDYSREKDLVKVVNTSLNETLSRTVLTSITTLIVVVSLFVFGGGLIRDFAAALTIGVLVGTYSSIAIASPCVLWMNRVLPSLQEWFAPAAVEVAGQKRKK
jgi:preprotein translocase subunit SecF